MRTRIRVFQHVHFEGLGSLQAHFEGLGYSLETTHWYRDDPAPALDSFDALIIMGGPMGVYDDSDYPWLTREKVAIDEAIAAGKPVLGICLGAQLIACVLGAQVTRNPHREIGWFELERAPDADEHPVGALLPEQLLAFHWHGDTFELPPGARLLAGSQACAHQIYALEHLPVVGLQCHLETTPESAEALLKHCADELDGSRYVQSAEEILEEPTRFARINTMMAAIVDTWLTAHIDL